MSDRNFLYLDTVWVKQQLGQLEQLASGEVLRESRSQEAGLGLTARLPIGDVEMGGRKRHSTFEVQRQSEDTPERMFARYYDHLRRDGRLITAPSDPLIDGGRYELHGTIARPGVFLVDQGFEIAYRLDHRFWRHDGDATGMRLALFGVCERSNTLHPMAIYIPEHAQPAPPERTLDRRKMLAGVAGAAAATLVAGGVAGWWALRPSAPVRTQFRIAGGPGELFHDPEVKELFAAEGLIIQHTQFGSGQLPSIDLTRYDAVFPASAIMARYVQGVVGNRAQFPTFGSPMIVMSWPEIIDVLAEKGIAERREGIWVFDVRRYLDHVRDKTRWPAGGPLGDRRLLLRTTDPSMSNSAAMFIAVASYALNGNNTVTDQETVAKVLLRLRPCFADQGNMDTTTGYLRDAYFEGAGAVPIGWVYEDDVVDQLIAGRKVTYLYPTPNVLSQHYFIPVNDHPDGDRIGRILQNHPRLIQIAQERYGNRYFAGNQSFAEILARKAIQVPDHSTLDKLGLAEVPSTDILGSFIDALQPQRKSPA